ncbi:RagB/SusD family nutrient uptake outer membrane protein [Chitinophaga sp. SYP-B3965]|uniref:RagB/SusD family nutrient uptake outer membrane protein n=1 Tax=Chitinophaga sp. SYP-B3965 TaxID=2663120 RepID=UPI001299B8EB|nr:RagB/SusD family nutrient uptake outer membrane protein [Chitinophaga sp. SYP-B3965]MRG45846.1 RagB/SusD family nutrient uptake outer membrane protein [Chitinophaga sp. SYP-B3965]
MRTKYLLIFLLITCSSCKKFLGTKSNQILSTPGNLEDLQLLLDNPTLQNGLNSINTGTDEYYVTYQNWSNLTEVNKNGYNWDPQLNNRGDWSTTYQCVFYANTVLFNLDQIPEKGDAVKRNNIKGAALFIRAHYFYLIAQEFAPQYDPATATTDLGIVLRLDADFNEISSRSTVAQTYQQITSDLEAAAALLTEERPLFKTRPGKAACLALLARVYLQMGNYTKAKEHADACLKMANSLVDYNNLPLTAPYPMGDFNKNIEILYLFNASFATPLNGDETRGRTDSVLYKLFKADDVRKKALFKDNGNGTYTFKGSYTGTKTLFNGLAVDEVYLIRAECYARMNNAVSALEDLNALLQKRWATNKYVNYQNLPADQVLQLVLEERRKELLNRGTRWSDLRRLNKEPKFAITLKRELNGQIYELAPNDLRYTVLIPLEIMRLTDLPQNPR